MKVLRWPSAARDSPSGWLPPPHCLDLKCSKDYFSSIIFKRESDFDTNSITLWAQSPSSSLLTRVTSNNSTHLCHLHPHLPRLHHLHVHLPRPHLHVLHQFAGTKDIIKIYSIMNDFQSFSDWSKASPAVPSTSAPSPPCWSRNWQQNRNIRRRKTHFEIDQRNNKNLILQPMTGSGSDS